jgi:hypothetical protein
MTRIASLYNKQNGDDTQVDFYSHFSRISEFVIMDGIRIYRDTDTIRNDFCFYSTIQSWSTCQVK